MVFDNCFEFFLQLLWFQLVDLFQREIAAQVFAEVRALIAGHKLRTLEA